MTTGIKDNDRNEANRASEKDSLMAIARFLGTGSVVTDERKYAKQAAEIFKVIATKVDRDYRGLFMEDTQSKSVSLVDNLMLAVFAKAIGRTDVEGQLLRTCEDKKSIIAYSEVTRVLFSMLEGEELQSKVPERGGRAVTDELTELIIMLKDAAISRKKPHMELTLEEIKDIAEDNVALLALSGAMKALDGEKETAIEISGLITKGDNLNKKSGLYKAEGNASELFCSAAVGLFMAILAGADLHNGVDLSMMFKED
jgi:hypothetical protein